MHWADMPSTLVLTNHSSTLYIKYMHYSDYGLQDQNYNFGIVGALLKFQDVLGKYMRVDNLAYY